MTGEIELQVAGRCPAPVAGGRGGARGEDAGRRSRRAAGWGNRGFLRDFVPGSSGVARPTLARLQPPLRVIVRRCFRPT